LGAIGTRRTVWTECLFVDPVAGRYVCLAVTDSGRGFDESVARRLFEPFFTTRSAGTGLGLATVHEIVRDHDGAMNVQSKPECGSRFEAWLPAVAQTAPQCSAQRCCR
jgi:signal transduction histidine kinase